MMLEISVSKEKEGLLAFFFPGYSIFRDTIPMFFRGTKAVLIGEVLDRDDIEVILVKKGCAIDLDKKEGILSLLELSGVRVKDSKANDLKQLEDEEFLNEVKLAFVLKKFGGGRIESSLTIFQIFKVMFQDFKKTYSIYRGSGLHHRMVFSALITMMIKTLDVKNQIVSPKYRVVLDTNAKYLPKFRKAVLEYLETDRKEMDFISFLYSISKK